jgi:hypothetical protein
VTIVDNDTDALSLKLVETWNALTTRTIEVGPLPELSRGWFGFPGGWVGPGGGAGESVVMGEGARDPLTELHLRAASVGGSMRVQRTTIPDPLAIDATAPLGNALLARIDPPIDDDAVTSVGIELRWFVGALTPDGTADFPVPGGEALAPLSTLTVSLGAAAADVGEAPLSLPGSIAGRSSLAFRINNDRTGDGGARPRLEFAVNDATFGDLDGLFMLGHRLNVGAAAAPEGIGEALQGPLAANEGEEYIVRVEFRKLGFSETEIAYEVEAVDGEGTLATDGKRRLTVPAAFPPVRAIDELAIVFGAAIGFGDGPGGAIDDAIDAGEQGSWIDDIRVTTFGAQSPPRLSARHWTIYR